MSKKAKRGPDIGDLVIAEFFAKVSNRPRWAGSDPGTFYSFGKLYCLINRNKTPFVQPKPSCPAYSPPPASLLMSVTLYFSISLPVSRYTFSFSFTQRAAISAVRSFLPPLSRPQILIHSRG